MWVLVAAIFTGVLVSLYIAHDTQTMALSAGTKAAVDQARTTASMGTYLLQRCRSMPVGTHTQAALAGAGFPDKTPVGAAWVCVVSMGGSLPSGNTAVLYLDGTPRVWGLSDVGIGDANSRDIVQRNFAAQVAAVAAQSVAGLNDVSTGVVNAGDAAPVLHVMAPSLYDLPLTGSMPGSLTYHTPVLAAGVQKSVF